MDEGDGGPRPPAARPEGGNSRPQPAAKDAKPKEEDKLSESIEDFIDELKTEGTKQQSTGVHNFEILGTLGKGKFACVYKAKLNDMLYAVKKIQIFETDMSTKSREKCLREIKLLQQKRNELLSRMKVIQELQGNRPIIVRVFDELARQLAPRVFFTALEMKESNLAIEGVAESNNRISNQLRNFSESEWFDSPNVTAITADVSFGPQASQFSLTVSQTTPKKEEDE